MPDDNADADASCATDCLPWAISFYGTEAPGSSIAVLKLPIEQAAKSFSVFRNEGNYQLGWLPSVRLLMQAPMTFYLA